MNSKMDLSSTYLSAQAAIKEINKLLHNNNYLDSFNLLVMILNKLDNEESAIVIKHYNNLIMARSNIYAVHLENFALSKI